ncbi:hypothetical protein O0L34_g870 [Tuta absoluta]|nr:hypothetical protein O0L34_g870 [Tuta absoluta]
MFRTVLFMLIASGSIRAEANSTQNEEVKKSSECCSIGHLVVRIVNESNSVKHLCWEPSTNTSTSIALTCSGDLSNINLSGTDYKYSLNDHGQLVFKSEYNEEFQFLPPDFLFEPGQFCMANVRNFTAVVFCAENIEKTIPQEVNHWCMVVSGVLLLITSVIYAVLPELRDLLGKSIVNLCLSLGLGLAILAANNLFEFEHMGLCAARGHFTYFFLIASFFWMNAISIQILFGIRRPMTSNYRWREREFIHYAIYAWTCPAVLSCIMAIYNHVPGTHSKPGIGLTQCWFFNKDQQWIWMYSVMSILTAVNILIFVYVLATLWKQTFSSSHIKAIKYKITMTLRLAGVMGVAWAFEMIGSLVKNHIIWELIDLVNSLQGLIIFLLLVVFRRKTIKAMHRHGWLDCVSGPVERYLAVGEDEEEVVEHTMGVTLNDAQNNTIIT